MLFLITITIIKICSVSYFNHSLQFDGVSRKLADAIGQFLHSHAVLVVLPTEVLLIQVDLLQITSLGCKFKPSNLVWEHKAECL